MAFARQNWLIFPSTDRMFLIRTAPLFRRKNRVGNSQHNPSGRLSCRGHFRSVFTPRFCRYTYQSVPGRSGWPSRDPLDENGGANLYSYVNNSPVNYYDVLGSFLGIPTCSYGCVQIQTPQVPQPTGVNTYYGLYKPFPKYNPPDANKECCCLSPANVSARRTDSQPTRGIGVWTLSTWTLHLSVDVKATGCVKDIEIQWQRCWNGGAAGYMGGGNSIDVSANTALPGVIYTWEINARIFYLECRRDNNGSKWEKKRIDAPMSWIYYNNVWSN